MTTTESTGTTGATDPTVEPTTAKEQRHFNVEYTLEVVDDLPPARHGGGGGGQSPLEVKLEELKGREDAHAKWVLIGKYGNATAAGAAANVLRQRHGRNANAEGFEFAYRKIDQNGSSTNGLFVRFDPAKIVPGAKEQHEADEAARKARLEEARKEREAKAGNVEGTKEATTATDDAKAATAAKVAAAQKAAAAKK